MTLAQAVEMHKLHRPRSPYWDSNDGQEAMRVVREEKTQAGFALMTVGKWYAEIEDEADDGTKIYGGIFQCIEIVEIDGSRFYTMTEDDGESVQYISDRNATPEFWTEQA